MASIRQRGKTFRAELYVNGKRSSQTFRTLGLAQAWAERQECRVAGMPMLRAALEDHRLAITMSPRLRAAIARANYSHAEILESCMPVDDNSGIYFLIRDCQITYLGQTTMLFQRLAKHRRDGRRFDSFAFIPCPKEQLNELESIYITMLLPEENNRL